jgi:hypothetical protein
LPNLSICLALNAFNFSNRRKFVGFASASFIIDLLEKILNKGLSFLFAIFNLN